MSSASATIKPPQPQDGTSQPARFFSISTASKADIPDLVTIAITALEYDIITRFMFSPRHSESMKIQQPFWTALWTKACEKEKTHVIKATLNTTGETVGFGVVRWEDGKWEAPPSTTLLPPEFERSSFLDFYGKEQNRNYRKLMAGQEHWIWQSLYVAPDYQRKGIGSSMLKWAFDEYGLGNDFVFVQTLAGAEKMYEKYGWVEKDATVIDLAEWGGVNRGYGVHRSPQLVKGPGPFPTGVI